MARPTVMPIKNIAPKLAACSAEMPLLSMAISLCNVHTDQNKKEETQHGSLLFPVACYEDDMGAPMFPFTGTTNSNTSLPSRGPSSFVSAQRTSHCRPALPS